MNSSLDRLQEPAQDDFSLRDALAVLRKRAWMIAAFAIAIPTIVGAVKSKEPKIYSTSASLIIDITIPQYLGSNFRDAIDVDSAWWSSRENLETELRILHSHSQAVAVAEGLCRRKGDRALQMLVPNGRCNVPNDLQQAAPPIQGLVNVEQVKDTRMVNLSVQHTDPEFAALLANTAGEVYTQRNLERRLSQSAGASTWLSDEYGDITQQLNEAERALIDFKKKNNVVSVGIEDQQNDLSSRRKKLLDELNAVQVRLIALNAQRAEYAALRSADPMNDVSPGIADSPVVLKLKELYVDQTAKLMELRGKYLDKHPAVIAQEARVAGIKADLARESTLASKNVEAQHATALKQETQLKAAVDLVTHEALQLELRAIEYNRLRRNFDRLSKLSDQVGGRERETSVAGHLKTNNVRILDAALVPTSAIGPFVARTVTLAFFVALVLGIALAFLLEFLDSTVKTQDDVEKLPNLTFLGLIPSIQAAPGDSKDLHLIAQPKSTVAECCRAIRTNLLFMTPDKPARTLLVTSAGPQEGKSTTAVSLAIAMAQSGLRVLLVDTDLRRPRLHKAFGIPSSSDGVSKAIVGEGEASAMVRDTGVPNLWLLPCGVSPPNPAELLHAERFKAIVQTLGEQYDRVIFDSPPLGAVTDAAILARLIDGTIIVAKGGRTSKDALARIRRQLADANVNVLGCVLNDLDLSKNGYGSYYYARYGYYYGDGDQPAAVATTSQRG